MTAVPLRIRDLAVGYRSRRGRCAVLKRINATARAGELICVLGPNGIGKSTLLRTLVRLQPPLAGAIELAGIDLMSMTQTELGRRVGVVLTNRIVVDTLSAQRVVELGRYAYSGWLGHLTGDDRRAVDAAIDAIGVRHLADRDVSRLSDGERQRVMIARALAQEPLVFVLDEPTAFLDVSGRVELWALLRRLTRERELAVIVSTHDLELALGTAHTVWLIMPDGEMVLGTPEELVAGGAISAAFSTPNIYFDRHARGFRVAADESATERTTAS
ncbi:MAG: ABC transporter ATP-binding protein [Acidimicrobiia bacterium]|nr:ABC transporter ATP-binding protein [Acidimicrobiia bacterium]